MLPVTNDTLSGSTTHGEFDGSNTLKKKKNKARTETSHPRNQKNKNVELMHSVPSFLSFYMVQSIVLTMTIFKGHGLYAI